MTALSLTIYIYIWLYIYRAYNALLVEFDLYTCGWMVKLTPVHSESRTCDQAKQGLETAEAGWDCERCLPQGHGS